MAHNTPDRGKAAAEWTSRARDNMGSQDNLQNMGHNTPDRGKAGIHITPLHGSVGLDLGQVQVLLGSRVVWAFRVLWASLVFWTFRVLWVLGAL